MARAGVEPTTLRLKAIDSTNAPSRLATSLRSTKCLQLRLLGANWSHHLETRICPSRIWNPNLLTDSLHVDHYTTVHKIPPNLLFVKLTQCLQLNSFHYALHLIVVVSANKWCCVIIKMISISLLHYPGLWLASRENRSCSVCFRMKMLK